MFAMGGLTIAEGVLLACWIVVHCVMLWNWYANYVKPYDYGKSPLGLLHALLHASIVKCDASVRKHGTCDACC